jgi:hypothetical protein
MNRPIIEVWIPIKEIFQKDRITDEMIQMGQLRLRVKILTLPEGVEVTTEGVIHTGVGHPVCPVPLTVFLRADLKDGDGSFQELIRQQMPTGFGTILLDPPF